MSDITNRYRYWSYHRQRLGKQGANLKQVLMDIIGVYSSHPSGPLSLYARVKSFSEKAFHKLDEEQLAFRVPAMRQSVYCLPRETAHLAFAATIPPASDPYWEKRYAQKNISQQEYQDWKKAILKLAQKPMTAAEIKQAVDIPDALTKSVLNRMAFEGDLLRVGAKSLRSNIISYVATKTWAEEHFVPVNGDEALTWLAGEYLRAFGPVRIKDFQWWAGITAGKAKMAMSAHETVSIGNDYLLLACDLDNFESYKIPTQDSLDLLPQWDCYTMGYAPDGRERFVSPDTQQHIYGKLGATGGNALGVVLVNGTAHGSWNSRFAGSKMHVILNMFEKPSSQLNIDIADRFNGIAALLKAKSIVLEKK